MCYMVEPGRSQCDIGTWNHPPHIAQVLLVHIPKHITERSEPVFQLLDAASPATPLLEPFSHVASTGLCASYIHAWVGDT